jgi:quaternary ammonium compound-resistance protein SugE
VWVGIGAVGAALYGIFFLGEPATAPRLFFLALMVVAIAGLKATSAG